jgi:predicted N-formylglutamate amidohydrolase
MMARGLVPVLLSVHSFTAVWRGNARPWHCGILWDRDPRFALPLLEALRADASLAVGDNQPYSGRLKGDCLYRHGTLRGLPHALLEIRQDLIADEGGQADWAARLAEALRGLLGKAELVRLLSRVEFFGSHTDL